MPTYQFDAMDVRGQVIKETINAPNENAAQAKIWQLGYFMLSLRKRPADSSRKRILRALGHCR